MFSHRARTSLPLALLLAGCHVYDPALLNGRDAGRDASSDGEAGDAHGDVPTPPMDGADVTEDHPDAGNACDPIVAAGMPCIEPFSGQGFGADDPRLLAPSAIALSAATPPDVVVGDLGTGRVLRFTGASAHGTRVAGTGLLGVPLGAGMATATPLSAPSATLYLPSGDLLVADAAAHALFVLRASSGMLEPFGSSVFQYGPSALALPSPDTLLVAADNKIYSITLTAGAPGAPVAILGQACGMSCRGANALPAYGTGVQLDLPTGIDFDATYLYVADSNNCRVLRARRDGSGATAYQTTVFAGGACDRDSDILTGGSGASVTATSAHLGPVGDVRVGADGTVYLTDPRAHCAVLAVPTNGAGAGQLRLLAGSSSQCGGPGVGGVDLGVLGGLAITAGRDALYVVDQQKQHVVQVALGSGAPVVSVAIDPGAVPSSDGVLADARAGAVQGLAAVAGGSGGPVVYWSGAAEGRVYRAESGQVTVFAGAGSRRLTTPLQVAQLEPSSVAGLSATDGGLLFGLRDHHAIAASTGSSLFRLAGNYDVAGDPGLTGAAATSEALSAPGWPVVLNNNLYFSVEGPVARVYRLDGQMPSNPLTAVAGTATSGTGAPPDGGAPATSISLGKPEGLAVDASGNLYVADQENQVVWRVRGDGTIEIAAGLYRNRFMATDADSDARAVSIPTPYALAFDGDHTLYISDVDSLRVRALDLTTNHLVTVAGSGPATPNAAPDTGDFGSPLTATLGRPSALAYADHRLYIGSATTGRVRVLRLPTH